MHKAVLDGDTQRVRQILKEEEKLDQQERQLEQDFWFRTVRPPDKGGGPQENTGKAIHLAVTRESMDIIQLLFEHRAQLDSMVTRDKIPHYDVLHAATFCEGKGGTLEVIKYLLDKKPPITPNLEGKYALHMAFQVGGRVTPAIPLMMEDLRQRGLLEKVESTDPTPLEVGIYVGKLTSEELTRLAMPRPTSLKAFIKLSPASIPAFFERLRDEPGGLDALGPQTLANEAVTLQDICQCMREHPPAAATLLDALMLEPEVDNAGENPLPKRMGFGPRNNFERLQNLFNPPREAYYTYQEAMKWAWDSTEFKRPPWQQEFKDRRHYGHTEDVSIKVCAMKEIVCAEFMAAAGDADSDEIFSNDCVKAVVTKVWWGGAYKVDIIQLFFTLLGLGLLIVERAQLDAFLPFENHVNGHETARRLRPHHGPDTDEGPDTSHEDFVKFTLMSVEGFEQSAAIRLIGARGFVDLGHELFQLGGYWKMGRPLDYFTFDNLTDLLRAFLAIWVLLVSSNRDNTVQVILILLYWWRLLEWSFSETLMRELLPVTQLAKGLLPSSVVCLIAVCAFTHAKWVMHSGALLWPDVFYESFSLLMTQSLPSDLDDYFDIFFAFVAVCCFSVFFLNIFIGVIGESYSREKGSASLSLLKKKCGLCLTFLLRSRSLPHYLMTRNQIHIAVYGSLISTLCVCLCLVGDINSVPCEVPVLIGLQALALLACYQDPERMWCRDGAPKARYMWIVTRASAVDKTQQDKLRDKVASMRAIVKQAREILARPDVVR